MCVQMTGNALFVGQNKILVNSLMNKLDPTMSLNFQKIKKFSFNLNRMRLDDLTQVSIKIMVFVECDAVQVDYSIFEQVSFCWSMKAVGSQECWYPTGNTA